MKDIHQLEYWQLVYDVVRQIPSGRVTTYGLIASFLSLGSARMVGWALRNTHKFMEDPIPAHRVVNSKGELTGRYQFGDPMYMSQTLDSEGVIVIDQRIKGLANYLWNPAEDMDLDSLYHGE